MLNQQNHLIDGITNYLRLVCENHPTPSRWCARATSHDDPPSIDSRANHTCKTGDRASQLVTQTENKTGTRPPPQAYLAFAATAAANICLPQVSHDSH